MKTAFILPVVCTAFWLLPLSTMARERLPNGMFPVRNIVLQQGPLGQNDEQNEQSQWPIEPTQPASTKSRTGPSTTFIARNATIMPMSQSMADVMRAGPIPGLLKSAASKRVMLFSSTKQRRNDIVTIPVTDMSDIYTLVRQPTQMGVLSKIVSNTPGMLPGFMQMDVCTYELLEVCQPSAGSSNCSPEQCYGRCMSMPDCARVTFTPDGLCQMESKNCQRNNLRSSGNSFLRVSPIYAAFPGNCPENYLLDETMNDDDSNRVGCTRCTISECRAACDMIPDCAGFSFADSVTPLASNNRQCYIKADTCENPEPGTHVFYHKLAIYT